MPVSFSWSLNFPWSMCSRKSSIPEFIASLEWIANQRRSEISVQPVHGLVLYAFHGSCHVPMAPTDRRGECSWQFQGNLQTVIQLPEQCGRQTADWRVEAVRVHRDEVKTR